MNIQVQLHFYILAMVMWTQIKNTISLKIKYLGVLEDLRLSKDVNSRHPAKMEAKVDRLCLLAQPKEGQQQFTNKKQPELTENRTVWKSDNQGVKEETLTQTGRGGGDWQPGGEDPQKAAAGGPSKVADCGTGQARLQLADPTRWWLADPVAPHSHLDKPRGTAGE